MRDYYAHNMEVVAYHDLDSKPAIKLAMQVVNDRWYLYLAHFWHSGWTVLDVTDPARPEKVAWVPGPENTWTCQVQVAEGKLITGMEQIPQWWGGKPEAPYEEGICIWDVSCPMEPRRLGHWKTGGIGTHRNYYDGGRYVHLSANMPGFSRAIYVILDIEDPEHPTEVGKWFLAEQFVAGGAKPGQPAATLHEPSAVEAGRAYLGYGRGGMVILDISDVRVPRLVSRLEFGPALGSRLGVHTVLPLKRRKLALVNTEAIEEDCDEPMNFAGVVDISDEFNPRLLSFLPTPVPPPDAPYQNFHRRGGRFGPHNQHQYQNKPCHLDRDDRMYLSYFNAGLRVYDISDPYLPREVGYFVPPQPTERLGYLPKTLVSQTEDVLVDARGNAYVTDKNQGLYVVRYTGD